MDTCLAPYPYPEPKKRKTNYKEHSWMWQAQVYLVPPLRGATIVLESNVSRQLYPLLPPSPAAAGAA